MKTKIFTLLFILSYSGVVLSSCSNGFDLECWYDILFGDEDSSEEESVEQSHSNSSQSKDLSSVIHNTDEKLQEIPKILGYLQNLTKTVTHFQHELNIGSDEDKSKDSPKSSPKNSGEKDSNSRLTDNELASNLSKIPRLVSDVSNLTEIMKTAIEKIDNNKPIQQSDVAKKPEPQDENTPVSE